LKTSIYQKLNDLIAEHYLVMIEQKDGIIYHLVDHWKHLNWQRKSERVPIGRGQISDKKFEYLTHPFPIKLQRTKFN
jgi:hypothetical protein